MGLLGRRVSFLSDGAVAWHTGTIWKVQTKDGEDGKQHLVVCDDGEERWLDLTHTATQGRLMWLPMPPAPAPAHHMVPTDSAHVRDANVQCQELSCEPRVFPGGLAASGATSMPMPTPRGQPPVGRSRAAAES